MSIHILSHLWMQKENNQRASKDNAHEETQNSNIKWENSDSNNTVWNVWVFLYQKQVIDEDNTSYNEVQKKYKINLQNLIKNLKTLNTPRYSLRKWWSSFVGLTRQAIWKSLHLSLADLLLRRLNLLLLHIMSFWGGWFHNGTMIDSIWTLKNLRFFCLLAVRIAVLKKPMWGAIIKRTQLLKFLKNFFHGRWRSRQLSMPIPAVRTIWTKTQLVPASTEHPLRNNNWNSDT